MQLSPSARIMDTAEHDDVSVRCFHSELVTGRVQHGKAGELPRPCQMQHRPGGHLVELIVQRFSAQSYATTHCSSVSSAPDSSPSIYDALRPSRWVRASSMTIQLGRGKAPFLLIGSSNPLDA